MWYTRGTKNVVTLREAGTSEGCTSGWRCTMDNTVPHYAPEDNPYTVYALIDPRDYTTRYIGITDDVYARFAQHLRCDGVNPEKDTWISELKTENVMLIMKTLEVVQGVERARERETFWIHHYRFLGVYLYNQQIPTIRLTSTPYVKQPPLFKLRKPDSNYGRQHKYGGVKDIVVHYHKYGTWPVGVSEDMKRWYKFMYFTQPTEAEKASKSKRHKQHIKAYARGLAWIAEAAQEGA